MTREQMIATAETFIDFDAGRYWERGVEKPMPAHYAALIAAQAKRTDGKRILPSAQAEHRRQ